MHYGLEGISGSDYKAKRDFSNRPKVHFYEKYVFQGTQKHCFVSMMTRRAPKLNLMLSKSDTQNSAMSNIADFTSSSFHSVKMQFWSQLS